MRGEHPFKIQRGSLKWQIVMKLSAKDMTRAELTKSCVRASEVTSKALNELIKKGIITMQEELCALTEKARHSFRRSIAEYTSSSANQQATPAAFKPLQKKNQASALGMRPGSNDYRAWKSKG